MSSTQWLFRNGAIAALRTSAEHRIRRWARNRQGEDTGLTALRPGRVYILPTGVGLVYGLMAFTMLLGSMNYNNNLSFALTFLLVGLGFVAMYQCQRNIVGLELSFAGAEPVFAGQVMQFRIAVTNRSRSTRYGLRLRFGNTESTEHDLKPEESRIFVLPVTTEHRGWAELQRFSIQTRFPFELFRSWAWLHMNLRGLVYPRAAERPPQPPPTMTSRGHRQHDARGEEDFAGLRRYRDGDSPRHVAWKAFARSGQLLSKRFAGADTSSQWFDLSEVPGRNIDERLSIVTRWIIDADRSLEDYGLRLGGEVFEPAHGDEQRRRCLIALALFEETPS